MKYMMILILLMPIVSAMGANFDCPGSVNANEEFSCSVEITDAEGVWDFKFNLEKDGGTIAEIWNPEKESWGSSYYYLQEFIEKGQEKQVKLKIKEPGNFKDVIKFRQGSKREFFDYEIKVEESAAGTNAEISDSQIEKSPNEQSEALPISPKASEKSTISLSNSEQPNDSKGTVVVYESKDSKILRNLSYAFIIFLVAIIAMLLWEKL